MYVCMYVYIYRDDRKIDRIIKIIHACVYRLALPSAGVPHCI